MTAGQTVALLGLLPHDALERLAAVLGSTGLLVVAHPRVQQFAGGVAVRALPVNTGILSHAIDVVILPSGVERLDLALLAEECRRILAPRGWLAAVLPEPAATALAHALRAVPFRTVVAEPAGALVQMRARGP